MEQSEQWVEHAAVYHPRNPKESRLWNLLNNHYENFERNYQQRFEMVIYKSKMTHGKNKRNFLIVDAEEFIAFITQHIPEKSFQLVRYYGFYSNRSRGERRKEAERETDHDSTATPEEVEVIDVSSYKPPRLPSKTWRECIKKVWEVDPLECPKCHAEMKIISFISKSQSEVIRKILEHLGLWEEKIRLPSSNSIPPHLRAV